MKNSVHPRASDEEKPEQQNISTIARLAYETLHARSVANRISDAITRFSGSMMFLLIHLSCSLSGYW